MLLLLLFKSDVIIVTSFIRGTFLIRTPPSVPSVSVLERFDCTGQNIPRAFSLHTRARRSLKVKQGTRSIQPKFRPVRPGKEDHLKRWTSFFETFPVGPNGSIELWTEISGNLVEWIAPLQVLVKRMTLRRFVIIKAK